MRSANEGRTVQGTTLIAQGVHPSRVTSKGYGERRLSNHCVDGVECSEEEHQMNRRTEFIITGCKDCVPNLGLQQR